MGEIHRLYSGRFLELVADGHWEYVRRVGGTPAVGIIALTPEKKLLLVEQYRIPVHARTIELPAGLVGDGDELTCEKIEEAAARELLEETGYRADRWQYLYEGPSSAGLTDESLHLVLASGLHKVGEGGGVAGEQITIHEVPLERLTAFLDAQAAAGIRVDVKVRLAGCIVREQGA